MHILFVLFSSDFVKKIKRVCCNINSNVLNIYSKDLIINKNYILVPILVMWVISFGTKITKCAKHELSCVIAY